MAGGLIFVMLGVSACSVVSGFFGANLGYPNLFADQTAVFIACSQECSDRAQCGSTTLENGDTPFLVFVNRGGPASQKHDAVIQHNQPVTVLESRQEQMVSTQTQAEFPMTFYRINYTVGETAVEGWVHGQCVADREISR